MTKNILSIDIGTVNFAYCIVSFSEQSITNVIMTLSDLTGGKKTIKHEKIIDNLIMEMNNVDLKNINHVLIENQPSMKNPRCKSIASSLFMYFKLKGKSVFFVSPSIKLSKEQNKLKYNERKKESIKKCEFLLVDCETIIHNSTKENKKKDDLSDCVCMAYEWNIRNN